ncbi:gamma-glutamyltransferase family protein [Tessaracoccus sp. SD287]|uniref:gamma-glutamyltransferase family protein n=1 Tax=Tessaracoccus sp. SD287 TaxID=2782008 RepID=UPI001A977232|nr:gamma-glutamyltransferase family protein [Tessaracoccus sp. SD287]MBO1030920.1 gamma-glutamyltransferase family protein [Tessaracoccus sp. SD287]
MRLTLDELVWPGRHQPILASHGMVATSQPLAAQAGVGVLRDGGTAVDAAIATAAVATVVEPATSSLGGDAFAIVWDGARLHGLNGSGRSPSGLSAEHVRSQGHHVMPQHGWLPVTVPGAPAAWRDLHQRFGRLPFSRLLEPAADYAERGHPASPISVWHWRREVEDVHPKLAGAEFAAFPALFAPGGRPPGVGDIWRSAEMARTLRLVAATNSDTVYTGEVADRIASFSRATGGLLTHEDLSSHTSTWVDPVSTDYRGFDVWELPPNGQGLAALIALNILEGFDLSTIPPHSAEGVHLQIEAMKLGCIDARRYITDPDHRRVPTEELLSKDYAATRRALIGEQALVPEPGSPRASDTVYLCAADSAGMMVSYIQSSFHGFGSHVVVPQTGMVLQNRGAGFSLDGGHPNVLEPAKRPFHTLIPGFLTRAGAAIGPFGVMGGNMQPQGHLQMVVNTIDHHMDPQTSLDQPRWFWHSGRRVLCEPLMESGVLAGLRDRGHQAEHWNKLDAYGRGQMMWRLPSGAYIAGSDPRGDGQAAGY